MPMERQSIFKELSIVNAGMMEYHQAWQFQRDIFQKVKSGDLPDTLILLEHPHTYTLGKVTDKKNLLADEKYLSEKGISVVEIDRGGDITYHGPGQLVGYPIIDLKRWKQDSHKYLRHLEEVLIRCCNEYNLEAGRKDGLTGVWIDQRKIAAIGIKISSWITMHGFAFNVNTDLTFFDGIIPCGITDKEVTSLHRELKDGVDIEQFKNKVIENFSALFEYNSVTEIYKNTPFQEVIKEA